jgi:hypothetical protein
VLKVKKHATYIFTRNEVLILFISCSSKLARQMTYAQRNTAYPMPMIPPSETGQNPPESGLVPVKSRRFPLISDRNPPEKHTEDGSSIPGWKAPYRILAVPDKSIARNHSGTTPYTTQISLGTSPYSNEIPSEKKNLNPFFVRKTPEIDGTCIPYPGSENHRIIPATSDHFLYFSAGNGRKLT